MFPVRCFSCGSIIGDKIEEYRRRVERGEEPKKVLDDLGVKRYCCRRMFISYKSYISDIGKYKGVKGFR